MSFVASSSLFLKTTRVGSLQCIQHDQPILSSSIMMMMMMKKKNPSMIVRTYYQEHLRRRFNVQTQKMEYEDASNMVKRFYEDRHRNHTIFAAKYNYYEKPASKKRRILETKEYKKKLSQVTDLMNYIQFMKTVKK